jgi:hypothetical protein
MAVSTAQDVRVDEECWGGVGGEAAAYGESEIDWRKGGDRIRPWFFVIYGKLVRSSLPSSAKETAENGIGTYLLGTTNMLEYRWCEK